MTASYRCSDQSTGHVLRPYRRQVMGAAIVPATLLTCNVSLHAAALALFRRRHVECRVTVEEAVRLQHEAAAHRGLHRKVLGPHDVVVAENMPERDRPIGDGTVGLGPARQPLA